MPAICIAGAVRQRIEIRATNPPPDSAAQSDQTEWAG
jgi:hypothetical protein